MFKSKTAFKSITVNRIISERQSDRLSDYIMQDESMNQESHFLMYQTENGDTKIQVHIENETVWMIQKAIAELFQKSVKTINEHIKNIYSESELEETATIRRNRIVQIEGIREVERKVAFYNLEMIIAIGYRVRSHRGTEFHQWATERLNEYLVKGFVMDDERLKEIRNLGQYPLMSCLNVLRRGQKACPLVLLYPANHFHNIVIVILYIPLSLRIFKQQFFFR